jgi:hypothetical protein
MSAPHLGGASISARTRTPSLNLSRLCELLVQAFKPNDAGTLRFARYADGKLLIDLRETLRRLYKVPGFSTDLAPGETTGFLQDLELPPRGTTAKLGGRLVPGSEGKTTAALEKLHATISRELDAALPEESVETLVTDTTMMALEALARRLQVNLPTPPATAALVPVGFAPPNRKAAEREKDVARLLSAVETVEGRDWLDRLIEGIKHRLKKDDFEDDEIAPILESIRAQRGLPGSQMGRFLDFLDDDALARVRLQVTFKLMASISAYANAPGFQAYVERVHQCFASYASASGQALMLDVSTLFGQRNNGDLADLLRKATFYQCLPVWAEWSVQLFEARRDPGHGFATQREVSYRFRINGTNPDTGKSAFASRLDRIEERLLEDPGPQVQAAHGIAELVFLSLVIPDSLESPTPVDPAAVAARIADALKADPEATLRSLLAELRAREPVVGALAHALIQVLRTKSTRLVDDANRVADKFYVAVHQGIINWAALRSMTSKNTEILDKNPNGHDHIAWFKQLTITDTPGEVRALASYWVETQLMERSITPTGPRQTLYMSRNLESLLVPVRFVPFIRASVAGGQWHVADSATDAFSFGSGVEVEYDVRALTLSKGAKNEEKARREHLRTAGCAAFALLTYLTLWELVRRLRGVKGLEDLAMYMVRLQTGGKESEPSDGNAAVYAACQAVERALSRELLVKMQGFHTQGNVETARFRKRNSLLALQGSFPIVTAATGTLEQVAVLSYVTRPSDSHPLYPDADGYLFVSRTFCADRAGDALTLRVAHMQSRLVETRAAFREPELILEEIARLEALGYRHIILLSHHFGNRHIGRAAERHAPHGTQAFLESVAAKFPDVYLYPLRRDVFPATRLHTRSASESAFEVVTFADHQRMYEQAERDLLRGLQPIYTFATLAVVSEEGRPQSGFCTYFFDIEQRLSNFEWSETVRQNILGTTTQGQGVRASLLAVLRGIHYLESERAPTKTQVLPVLDPYGWAMPSTTAAAGELEVMRRRGKGAVLLSFPALLAHVTKVLHKDKRPV